MLVATSSSVTAQEPREQDAFDIGVDAYVYLYPLVMMDVTRLQLTNVQKAKGFQGPMNAFNHFRAFPDANFKTVVRPNFDTLYSSLWADMTEGPVIVSVPDSGGRYYWLPGSRPPIHLLRPRQSYRQPAAASIL